MHEPGLDSRDLRSLGLPNPAEQGIPATEIETRVQQRGSRQYRIGLTVLACAPLTALAAALATEGPTFHNTVAACFALLALTGTVAVGSILTSLGAGERQQRPQRAAVRLTLANQQQIIAMQEQMAAALDRIAEHMPENQKIHAWRGVDEAVRNAWAEQTGTGGPSMRPSRSLGLVRPSDPGQH